MNYIINAILAEVHQQQPTPDGQLRIRINGFEDIRIYERVCKALHQAYDNNLALETQLSDEKYKLFQQSHHADQPALLSMAQNNWVATHTSLTHYRNLPQEDAQLIVLMGTEAVDDQGSLKDCFFIDPAKLEAALGPQFHRLFTALQGDWSDTETDCINKLWTSLFAFTPVNICKLSNIADNWGPIDGIDSYIAHFYEDLPKWGLCKQVDTLPSASTITSKSRRNILQTNHSFISRDLFRNIPKTQYNNYCSKISTYKTQEMKYGPTWSGWATQKINSFDSYILTLQEFLMGTQIAKHQEDLLFVDFSITQAVLDIKLEKGRTTTKTSNQKVYGAPLTVFSQAVFFALQKSKNSNVDELRITVESAELVDAVDPASNEDRNPQLAHAWQRICHFAGGVIDFIGNSDLTIDEQSISLQLISANVFSPKGALNQVELGVVTTAKPSKKLNKIIFTVQSFFQGASSETFERFEWSFSNQAAWLIAFEPICQMFEQWDESHISTFLPLCTSSGFHSLMHAKCEEEFLDALEQTTIEFDFDICNHSQTHFQDNDSMMWILKYQELGTAFLAFCKSIYDNGFYSDLLRSVSNESKIISLIDCYTSLGEAIINHPISDHLEWVLDFFIHAFIIEPDKRSLLTGQLPTGCIAPPFHPAVLQKITDQTTFILDGCCEWHQKNEAVRPSPSFEQTCTAIEQLEQLSEIQEGIDIFPLNDSQYYGATKAFANYCICGQYHDDQAKWMQAILQKDAVFDDNFKDGAFKQMNAAAIMLYDVLKTYQKAFPNNLNNLSIAIINPSDLQPVIAAIYKHVEDVKKRSSAHEIIQIALHILVTPENKGGRNYLAFWVNTFFSQDESVTVKIFLNEYSSIQELQSLCPSNLDIVFLMDILKQEDLNFAQAKESNHLSISDCRFPIIVKPAPVSANSVRRKIEITQPQFHAATIHSQVIYYRNTYEQHAYHPAFVTKTISIDNERQQMIWELHKQSNWIVCVDGGMDGALLRDGSAQSSNYAVIGFSTGKGPHGQYNLTITARNSIIESVKTRLRARFQTLFHWDLEKTARAADICLDAASTLDGISLFNAINPNDENMHEFMAYILTTIRSKQEAVSDGLRIIVHLDSYQHWFSKSAFDDELKTESRPDFLMITANIGNDGIVHLDATIIECKIALSSTANTHKEKAREQVENGIAHLSEIFNPNSKSIRRRYWYAQLYRALTFSHITFGSNTDAYSQLAAQLRGILDGQFTIDWQGKVSAYWIDMPGDDSINSTVSQSPFIEMQEVPQKMIQRLLLGDDPADITFAPLVEETPMVLADEPVVAQAVPLSAPAVIAPSVEPPAAQQLPEPIAVTPTPPTEDYAPITTPPASFSSTTALPSIDSDETQAPDAPDSSEQANTTPLQDIRVLIGKDRQGKNVYWDFGHPQLANRHLLVTGTSGQGKTYSIQTMLQGLSQHGVSSVIFDYTEGFRTDQLEPEFVSSLDGKIDETFIYYEGIPVNPFRRQEIEFSGKRFLEKISDVALRIANIFSHVYDFKEQQFSAIYEACRTGIEKHGDTMSMEYFREELQESSNNAAKTVLSKMAPFVDSVAFEPNAQFDWDTIIHADGKVMIFQLTNFVREIQVAITEMVLWDAWHYFKKNGNKNTPFVVVLDEAQNLSMKKGSPAEIILREGRKFGWSAWFATQSLKSLSDTEIVNLRQAQYSLYFKPIDEEMSKIAKQIDPTAPNGGQWVNQLKSLQKGQCIISGDRVRMDGSFGQSSPTVTNITSFQERSHE
ncbi:DUF853 family protein [Bengtsoniella intestinalis]|uniref:helicase HerA-like domain-containing protein n=1 Tax=Bengtsoniella intestinalis TaxID=3073143 RepID=UPI00391FC62F